MRNIKDIKNTLTKIETISKQKEDKFNEWNQTMSVMMQDLKNKIAKARHIADGVRFIVHILHFFTQFFFHSLSFSTSRFVYRWHQNR